MFMQNTQQNLLDDSGMSMIQVMVAAAMMGGLALLFAQMMSNQAKESKTAKINSDIVQWKNTIVNVLSKNALCNATFTGIKGGTELSGLKSSSGSYLIEAGVPSPNGARVTKFELEEPAEVDGTRAQFNLHVTFSKEREDNQSKRTTIGPETVKETFEFFARPCLFNITNPTQEMLKYDSLDLAVSQCDSNCDEIAQLWSPGETISNCDCVADNAESVVINGATSWALMVYYNCAIDERIATCDNAGD